MTQTTFDTGPESYEEFFVPDIGRPLANDLIASASLLPGERVLDVACGTGVVTRLAATTVGTRGSVAGLDVSPGMLSVARSVTPSELAIDWYETSAEVMPLPDRSFDVVLCQMGLQFIPDKRKALQEIRRVLRPGGRVMLSVPGPTPALFSLLSDVLAKRIDPESARFVGLVFSLHDADELRRLLSDAGFSNVEVRKTQRTLQLPAPRDFLWRYIDSTPLAALVREASEAHRDALENEVCRCWQPFVVDGGLRLDLDMTTVRAE